MDSIKRNLTTNFLFLRLFHFFILVLSCLAIDTISKNQLVLDGQTLVSEGKVFELGFFSPSGSHERYIGIWYGEISVDKVVWVANHANPLLDTSGTLMIGSEGNLVLIDGKNHTIWSTAPTSTSSDIVAVLHDSGNLVLAEKNSNANVLWESFNHPRDTFLGGMEIGLNTKTGDTTFLTSWRSDKDPSPGSFICALDPQAVPQVMIWNGTVRHWRSGQWDGRSFTGVPGMNVNYLTGLDLVKDSERGTIYLTYATFNSSFPSALFLSSDGVVTEIYRDAEKKDWIKEGLRPDGPCDTYGTCGSFGICNDMETPICRCLRGYEPKSSEEWSKGNWTGGCERRIELQCKKSSSLQESKYGFFKLTGVKLPDFSDYLVVNDDINCEGMCLKNCSCVAYAYVNGIGCMVWEGNLIDIREFSYGSQELYLQLAYSELGEKKKVRAFVIVLIIISMILSLGFVTYILSRWKTKLGDIRDNFWHIHVLGGKWKTSRKTQDTFLPGDGVNQGGSSVVPFFSLGSIAAATDNFSLANKLGEGGFGPVYKGKLSSGQDIAVKRLSRSSGQGIEEFKNEVILISKLQHRNLVKLLGFCVEGEEKLLLYEYMPNKSLDAFLFGSRNVVLDWDQRYRIIEGIARGLLYLHRDSRLRVIHRDLKTSNILLDEDMNPKISDFGMARTFCANQTLANTNRVVGTYGYMSPEYAMQGIFSEKSDVFSFGVLLLEIVSSMRNTSFHNHENYLNLLGYAWQLWNEGKALELLDPTLANSSSHSEVIRCIHVGLLCVQEQARDRPVMASIVFMLSNDTALPTPKQPAFFLDRSVVESNLHPPNDSACSKNCVSMTTIDGR